MKNKLQTRKKRIIEIYFVLYLAALILLIPSKEEKSINNNGDDKLKVFQLPFSLRAEKTSLNAIYRIDSAGIRIISIDSVNSIFYTGNVEKVDFEFIVEDKYLNQNLVLKSDEQDKSNYFSFYENSSNSSAKFLWKPTVTDRRNKTFIVTVIAKAISRDSLNFGKIVEDKLQFSLNLSINNENENGLVLSQNNQTIVSSQPAANPSSNSEVIIPQGNLILLPRDEIIKTIAYDNWENEITIFGLNPSRDIRKQPDLIISREPDNNIGGNAKIAGFTENSVLIRGEAPGYGTLRIKLKLIRHSDGQEVTKEFKVIPQLLEEPKIPTVMYPGITYQIDPKMPFITGKNIVAELRDSQGHTYSKSQNGNSFSFTPSVSDTGKTLYLERYISGNLLGQKYQIKVNYYQKPEIFRITETAANQIRIYTNSYGDRKSVV